MAAEKKVHSVIFTVEQMQAIQDYADMYEMSIDSTVDLLLEEAIECRIHFYEEY